MSGSCEGKLLFYTKIRMKWNKCLEMLEEICKQSKGEKKVDPICRIVQNRIDRIVRML